MSYFWLKLRDSGSKEAVGERLSICSSGECLDRTEWLVVRVATRNVSDVRVRLGECSSTVDAVVPVLDPAEGPTLGRQLELY